MTDPYLVIGVIILVIGVAGSYVARRKGGGLIAMAMAYLETQARAARDRQRAKDRAREADEPPDDLGVN